MGTLWHCIIGKHTCASTARRASSRLQFYNIHALSALDCWPLLFTFIFICMPIPVAFNEPKFIEVLIAPFCDGLSGRIGLSLVDGRNGLIGLPTLFGIADPSMEVLLLVFEKKSISILLLVPLLEPF